MNSHSLPRWDEPQLHSGVTRRRRRGEYGIDGNITMVVVMIAVMIGLSGAAWALARAGIIVLAVVAAFLAAFLLTMLIFYFHTTRRGKFLVWADILDSLRLRGDEHVLDVGCGRGAVLTMVAERLPRGRAVGIDIWSKRDQSGNGAEVAERNLAAEGVSERCELVTGDMRSIPFPDGSFDLIVSSLAIHNVFGSAGRSRAIAEITRVLAPGGRVVIADLAYTATYAQGLGARGLVDTTLRPLGWRFWWGLAFPATKLITARKPGRPE